MRTLTDLRKLRHVVGVARAGSFTSASKQLAISQSALTKSVAEVEHLLGMRLFERLPRGVALTDAGQAFVPRAERILTDTEELIGELDELRSLAAGHLRIGVAPAAFASFLEHTVSAFARVYPGIRVEVRDGTIDATAQAVVNGDLDLVVGSTTHLAAWQALTLLPIAPLHIFFIARLDHPASTLKSLTAAQLLDYPVVMPRAGFATTTQLNEAYLEAGLTPRAPQYLCDHFPLVERLLLATDAISPVVTLAEPGAVFHERFAVFADTIPLAPQQLALGVRDDRTDAPAIRAFTDIFRGFRQDAN